MTKQTRRRLFLSFTFIFFATIPLIIFYTQGYRVSFEEYKIVKTGGIDLDISNSETRIYLNGELEKETIFIFRNAVFRNILPGSYDVVVEKLGYEDWSKTVSVEAGRVAKFISVRLFPENLKSAVLAEDIQSTSISPNKKFALVQVPSSVTSASGAQKTSQISMVELEKQSVKPVLTLSPTDELKETGWSHNSDIFYLLIETEAGHSLYTGSVGRAQELVDWSSFVQRSFPVAYDDTSIIAPSNSAESIYVFQEEARVSQNEAVTYSVSKLELIPSIIRPDIVRGISAFKLMGDEMIYLDQDGVLSRANATNGSTAALSQTSIAHPQRTKNIIASPSENIVAIDNELGLYVWQRGLPLEKIAEQVNGVSFAPDVEKLVYWTGSEINVYWLEKVFGPPSRVRGDREILTFENINNVIWPTEESGHITVQTDTSLIFTELDSRGHRNTVQYSLSTSPSMLLRIPGKAEIYTILEEDSSMVRLNYE